MSDEQGSAVSGSVNASAETWAFIDEYGNPNLATEVAGASQFFIVAAVVLDGAVVQQVRSELEDVRRAYFQTGEMKSSKLRKDRRRWLVVLTALRQVPFRFYGLVVDKRAIERTSGLDWKQSFYKNICGRAYGKLIRAYGSLHVRADRYGNETFQESFSRYIAQHHRPSLFVRASLEFVDSKDDVVVQLADVLCGLLARCYDAEKRLHKPEELLGLVVDRALLIDEWPPRYRPTPGRVELPGDAVADNRISWFSVARAEEYILKHEDDLGEDARCQVAVVERLLFERRLGDGDGHVPAAELLDNLKARGLSPKGEAWFRMSVIGKIRDAGVLITSSTVGYKLPTCEADLLAYVDHANTVCIPMLKRVKSACDAVKLTTRGEISVLDRPDVAAVRRLVDALNEGNRDEGSSMSDEHPGT